MNKIFLIDSENVGDAWISLLPAVEETDRVIVFYTEHSPHMSYKNLIILKDSTCDVSFVKCFEGQNALDFQLCTELGWLIRDNDKHEFVIVTNDNGFDVCARYWSKKGYRVRRIKASEIKLELKNSRILTKAAGEEPSAPFAEEEFQSEELLCEELPVSAVPDAPDCGSSAGEADESAEIIEEEVSLPLAAPCFEDNPSCNEGPAQKTDIQIPDEALEILYCVGRDNLLELHQALTLIYGPAEGKAIYNSFKNDSSYMSFLQEHTALSQNEKCSSYCSIVFSRAGVEVPDDFSDVLLESWKKKKNLNSLRFALMNRYGKANFNNYYSLIKSHIRIIDRIK